jgi:hypothetical protein
MTICFIPNDPLVAGLPVRTVRALPDRPAGRAGFAVAGTEPQDEYPAGSPGFVRWQSRQAAILAVLAWEKALGTSLTSWAPGAVDRHRLPLLPDEGDDINAYYDRASVSFFHHAIGGEVVHSGASTDVVAHEVGHAILDAIRPDLWDTNFLEVGGFHEAFGDVTAILTALADRDTRVALLAASPDLGAANDVEATAEQLSDAIRRVLGPTHNAAAPRRALNTFRWQLPSTMPLDGGPDVMIAEVHSIARIFTGCFYDLVRAIFTRGARTEARLWRAARTAARLLHKGAATAPQVPRFYQSVGRAMVLADAQLHGGVNRQAIGEAFGGHGIALGSSALLAPELALAGPAPVPDLAAGSVELEDSTRRDLRRRLGMLANTALTVKAVDLDGGVAKAKYRVPVALDGVDPRLDGVVATADVQVLLGGSGGRAAVLGALPRPDHNAEAVREFAASLAQAGQIAFEAGPAPTHADGHRHSAVGEGTSAPAALPTHAVVDAGPVRVLHRVRFACPRVF